MAFHVNKQSSLCLFNVYVYVSRKFLKHRVIHFLKEKLNYTCII